MANDQTKEAGAVRVHRDDRDGKKPLLWVLLALLALLAAAVLLWWLLADDDDDGEMETGAAQEEVLDDDEVLEDEGEAEAGGGDPEVVPNDDEVLEDDGEAEPGGGEAEAGGGEACGDDGTITDIAFLSAATAEDVEGCPVDLREVTVESVPSDKLFTVGTGSEAVFVSVGEEPEVPPQESEGRVDVNAGETLSLTGDVKTIASAEEAQAEFDVEPEVAEQLATIGFYVLATSIDEQT